MTELVGQTFAGRYRIEALIGEGGMGQVFQAHDEWLDRPVALKIPFPYLRRQPEFSARFLQEARSAVRLRHPGFVEVYDVGVAPEHIYLVMKFIAGRNLRDMLVEVQQSDTKLDIAEAVALVRFLAAAVQYAHEQNVLHRDIKPSNIMLEPVATDGMPYRPVITDLGLAKLLDGGYQTQHPNSLGTPTYMSPEQTRGEPADARSDVYALGVLLFELVTGRPPFIVRTLAEALRTHSSQTAPNPGTLRPDLPAPLAEIILRALAREPAERFQTAGALADALANAPRESAPIVADSDTMLPTMPYDGSLAGWLKKRGTLEPTPPPFPPPPSDLRQDQITVLNPDGSLSSTPLSHRPVRIGRAHDNDIVLTDEAASPYHALVEPAGPEWQIKDLRSANGTRLNTLPLLELIPTRWPDMKLVQIGSTWLRLERGTHTYVGAGVSGPAYSDQFAVVGAAADTGAISVRLDPPLLELTPGIPTEATVRILNSGIVDHFDVTLEGIPPDWILAPPEQVRLHKNQEGATSFTLQPTFTSGRPAGTFQLLVQVKSVSRPDENVTYSADFSLAGRTAFSLDLAPRQQAGVSSATYEVKLRNEGNQAVTLDLAATSYDDACEFIFAEPTLTLDVGENKRTTLLVKPAAAIGTGSMRLHSFTVAARAVDQPDLIQEVRGEWEETPPSFTLALRPPRQSGTFHGSYSVQIENQGLETVALQLAAADIENLCRFQLEPAQLEIPPGQERTTSLTIQSRGPLIGSRPKLHYFTVTATTTGEAAIMHQAQGEWEQRPPEFEVKLQPNRQTGTHQSQYAVRTANRSDSPLTIAFAAVDLEGKCTFVFEPPQLTIPAGQETETKLTVRAAAARFATDAHTHYFSVNAHPIEAPGNVAQIQGEWLQRPVAFTAALDPVEKASEGAGEFLLRLQNRSDAALTFVYEPLDELGDLAPATTTTVPAGQAKEVTLRIQARRPLERDEPRPLPFRVRVHPEGHPELAEQVAGQWTQLPPAFTVAIEPAQQSAPRRATYAVTVHNQSQAALEVALTAGADSDSCRFTLNPDHLRLASGQSRSADLIVRAHRRTRLKEGVAHAFTVAASTSGKPTITRTGKAQLRQRRSWLSWLPLPGGAPAAAAQDRTIGFSRLLWTWLLLVLAVAGGAASFIIWSGQSSQLYPFIGGIMLWFLTDQYRRGIRAKVSWLAPVVIGVLAGIGGAFLIQDRLLSISVAPQKNLLIWYYPELLVGSVLIMAWIRLRRTPISWLRILLITPLTWSFFLFAGNLPFWLLLFPELMRSRVGVLEIRGLIVLLTYTLPAAFTFIMMLRAGARASRQADTPGLQSEDQRERRRSQRHSD